MTAPGPPPGVASRPHPPAGPRAHDRHHHPDSPPPGLGPECRAPARGALAPGQGLPHDRRFAIGAARLRVTARIDRCAAINVNPETAARGMNVVKALQRGFGHIDMGVYAKVIDGGGIATGDRITVA